MQTRISRRIAITLVIAFLLPAVIGCHRIPRIRDANSYLLLDVPCAMSTSAGQRFTGCHCDYPFVSTDAQTGATVLRCSVPRKQQASR